MGVSITTVQALRAAARDAVRLREEGLLRLPDPDIVAKAKREQRVVLAFHLDFGDILAVAAAAAPSVINFHLRNRTPAAVNPQSFRAIGDCESELASGVRRLPIRRWKARAVADYHPAL